MTTKQLSRSQLQELTRRQAYSQRTWAEIEYAAGIAWQRLNNLRNRDVPQITERACIYVTGSFAREEASEGSDLDLFVLDHLPKGRSITSREWHERLNYVETARLISALDDAREQVGLRPFSRGGEFIKPHSFQELLGRMGSPEDDASNAFTARVLLLTNSRPLLNASAHRKARDNVLQSYWNKKDPTEPFFPIMLCNDIRRWWGVLCLNFEHNNRLIPGNDYEATPERRLENLKLRYTKLLSVYSTILGLVDISGDRGIIRKHAEEVFNAFPVDRLLQVGNRHASSDSKISRKLRKVLRSYDDYLNFASQDKVTLLAKLGDDTVWREHKEHAYEFHDDFAQLVTAVGRDRTLYEYCIV